MKNILTVVLTLAVVSSGLIGSDIEVHPGNNTITAALATANAGDRLILVEEGVYSNDPLFVYKPVTIKALDGLANKPIVSFLWSNDPSIIDLQEKTLFFTYTSLTLDGLEFTMEGPNGIVTRMFRNRAYTGVNWKFNDCLFRDASQATMSISSVVDSYMLANGSWHYDGSDYVDNAGVVIGGVTVAEDGEFGVLDTLIIDNCVFNNFMGGGAKIKHTGNGSGVYSYTQFTNNTVWNTDDTAIQIYMRDVNGGDANSLYGSAVFDHNTIHGVGGDGIFIKYIGPGSYITNTTISDVSGEAINCQQEDYILVDHSNWYDVGTEPSNNWIDGWNLQVDPLFADASTGDLTLLGTSPLHGAGSCGSTIGDPRWYTVDALPPVADAGDDFATISDEDGSAIVTLNGSGTCDPNGDALTFQWHFNGILVSTEVSFNYNLNVGVFTFTLTVIDGDNWDSDNIIVTVLEFGSNAALSFTGANEDYVDCGNDAELQMGTHDLTVEFWLKTSASGVQRIISNGGNSDDGYSIFINSAGKIRAEFSDGTMGDAKNNETIVNNGENWHHCAVVFDRDHQLRICVDGTCATKSIDTYSGLNFDNTTSTFVIGRKAETDATQSYTGILDEVRIWNTALDNETISDWQYQELTSSHPDISALQVYYKFNENSGSTANDTAGESNGTIYGAEWVVSDCFVGCTVGDLNGDGGWNVLDIVVLASCVLAQNCGNFEFGCAGDTNQDDLWNVLDIVSLANCVMAGTCEDDLGRADDASHSKLIIENNMVSIEADGFIGGVQMTLKHGDDFSIEMTDRALFADYLTSGNETRLLVITPETDKLFSYKGEFEITELIVANSHAEISVDLPLATSFSLSEAYPNPFNPTTTMTLTMPVSGEMQVEVYNLLGQVVATLVSGYKDAGTYNLTWDATDVSSGMYFVKAEAVGFTQIKKLILLK